MHPSYTKCLFTNLQKQYDEGFAFTVFYKQLFYKKHQAETGKKNQAKAKQHPETELLLFKKYSHSSSMLSFKNKYSQKTSVSVFVKLYD